MMHLSQFGIGLDYMKADKSKAKAIIDGACISLMDEFGTFTINTKDYSSPRELESALCGIKYWIAIPTEDVTPQTQSTSQAEHPTAAELPDRLDSPRD